MIAFQYLAKLAEVPIDSLNTINVLLSHIEDIYIDWAYLCSAASALSSSGRNPQIGGWMDAYKYS